MAWSGCESIEREDGELTDWYNFSGDFDERVFIRQTKKGASLSFKSDFSNDDHSGVYSFTGGVGWISEPMSEGFLMTINNRHQIKFDVTKEYSSWESEDKLVKLFYLPTWTSELDSGGFFFISFIEPSIIKDKALSVRVSSNASGSKRWFAIDLKQNFEQRIKHLRKAMN